MRCNIKTLLQEVYFRMKLLDFLLSVGTAPNENQIYLFSEIKGGGEVLFSSGEISRFFLV